MFFNLKNDDLENAIYMFVKIGTNMWTSIAGEVCVCAQIIMYESYISSATLCKRFCMRKYQKIRTAHWLFFAFPHLWNGFIQMCHVIGKMGLFNFDNIAAAAMGWQQDLTQNDCWNQ